MVLLALLFLLPQDLSTTSSPTFANLNLSGLVQNGVMVSQGSSAALTSLAASAANMCLVSTTGTPAWQTCPGSGGVSSLDGLNGALALANSSGTGSTITMDNASATAKGIAQFNGTNFYRY